MVLPSAWTGPLEVQRRLAQLVVQHDDVSWSLSKSEALQDAGKLPSASATSGRKSHLSRGASLDEVSGDTAWSSYAQHHLSPQPSGLKQSGQNWDSSCNGEWKQGQCELRLVGGLDISFVPDPGSNPGQDVQQVPGSDPGPAVPKAAIAQGRPNRRPGWAVAALVILSFPELDVVYQDFLVLDEEQRSLPSYAPGFLGFREVPVYQQLLAHCAEVAAGCFMPQVVLVDGCGRLHPERCGSASHLGVLTGLPTVGCAKSLLAVEGLSRRAIEAALAPRAAGPVAAQSGIATRASCDLTFQPEAHNTHGQSPLAGSFDTDAHQGRAMEEAAEACNSPPVSGQLPACGCSFPVCNVAGRSTGVMLHAANGELLGAAITNPSSKKPLYVSVGHRLSLETSLALVTRCSLARIPEPLRQADLRSRDFIRTHML